MNESNTAKFTELTLKTGKSFCQSYRTAHELLLFRKNDSLAKLFLDIANAIEEYIKELEQGKINIYQFWKSFFPVVMNFAKTDPFVAKMERDDANNTVLSMDHFNESNHQNLSHFKIILRNIDPSVEKLGYDMISLYMFGSSDFIKTLKGNTDAPNVIYFGKTIDIPESLLDVTANCFNLCLPDLRVIPLDITRISPKELINKIIRYHPDCISSLIIKERSKDLYFNSSMMP